MGKIVPHLIAGGLAIGYAWLISKTPYLQTGLQFVAPVMVILATHLAWAWMRGADAPGYAGRVLTHGGYTAFGLFGTLLLAEALAPMPNHASGFSEAVTGIFVVLFCVLIVVLIALVIAFAFRLLFWGGRALFRAARGKNDSHMNDGAVLVVAFLALAVMSAEGLSWAYRFDGAGMGAASRSIDAEESDVWAALSTATAPNFPLPAILKAFPQPVAVEVDEGIELGANRVVRLTGREGTGCLFLRVVERSDGHVTFEVHSDTSPMANWIAFQSLTYRVVPEADGVRLETVLTYEGLLAPQWVFRPIKRASAYLAMDVLARDVKTRAEDL